MLLSLKNNALPIYYMKNKDYRPLIYYKQVQNNK